MSAAAPPPTGPAGVVRLGDLPPAAPSSEGGPPPGPLVEPPFRVLIAEDHAPLREVLLAVLEPFLEVLELLEAKHGGEAVRIIRGERVDVAVLDFRMPGRTGLEAFAELRSVNPTAPGILVSAEADEGLRRDAAALTVHRVLAKPVTRTDLLAALDSALRTAYRAALPAAA